MATEILRDSSGIKGSLFSSVNCLTPACATLDLSIFSVARPSFRLICVATIYHRLGDELPRRFSRFEVAAGSMKYAAGTYLHQPGPARCEKYRLARPVTRQLPFPFSFSFISPRGPFSRHYLPRGERGIDCISVRD